MTGTNLLGIPETRLEPEPEVLDALASSPPTREGRSAVALAHPASSLAWAELARTAREEGDAIGAYAFARVGYHRGLDALRRAGWRGQGPVPWSHEPNRGVLLAFWELREAAEAIGERGEPERLDALLRDADPRAVEAVRALRADGRD